MNNKFLLIVIALIVVFGAFTFLGNKKTNTPIETKKSEPTSTQNASPTQTQPIEKVATVILTNTGFEPKNITVKVGEKITWTNKSGKLATVNSDDHPTHLLYPFLNLGRFTDGASVEVVVEKAGKYTYHNHFNASETGTITAE